MLFSSGKGLIIVLENKIVAEIVDCMIVEMGFNISNFSSAIYTLYIVERDPSLEIWR